MFIRRTMQPKDSSGSASRPVNLALRLMVVALCVSLHSPGVRAESERSAFYLSTEFYGPLGYTNPAAALNLQNGMANMVAFWPPADVGMQRDWLLIQTHHRLFGIVGLFIRLQNIFHLGDVIIIEFGHAPHFFPATA